MCLERLGRPEVKTPIIVSGQCGAQLYSANPSMRTNARQEKSCAGRRCKRCAALRALPIRAWSTADASWHSPCIILNNPTMNVVGPPRLIDVDRQSRRDQRATWVHPATWLDGIPEHPIREQAKAPGTERFRALFFASKNLIGLGRDLL